MKKKTIKYADGPAGKTERIKDFLPRPEELVFKENTIKITLSLSKSSVDYFKKQAKKHHTQYQKMIRILLDRYATTYSKNGA